MLLGILTEVRNSFGYRTVTFYGRPSHAIRLEPGLVTPLGCSGHPVSPTTPMLQRPEPWHNTGLGYSPFARRYLESRSFFPFLQVLRCFSSLRSLPLTRVPRDESRSVSRSRTSPDHSLLGGSPRHIAACNVLHRLLAPRHPPCTLSSLTTNSVVIS